MIVYLHGFNSAGSVDNDKVIELQKLEDVYIVTYDTFANAEDILNDLVDEISDLDCDSFVGTSLGGFFAAQLAKIFCLPCVMINPAFKPLFNLADAVGVPQTNYVTHETNTLTKEVLASYSRLPAINRNYCVDPLVIIADDDELIPAEISKEYFSDLGYISTKDGGHRYNKPRQIMKEIETYLSHTSFATDINS